LIRGVAVQDGILFRNDLSLSHFTRRFSVFNPVILANKNKRFTEFLTVHTPAESLFDRPDYTPGWAPHIEAQPPIYDALQCLTADVKIELTTIKSKFENMDVAIGIVGGDGLSYGQMLHIFADEPETWLFPTPLPPLKKATVLLPNLGLEPHGGYHGLHTGARNYRAFYDVIGAAIGSIPMQTHDPPVSAYNMFRFETYQLIRGVSEWLVDLSKTPGAPSFQFPDDWRAGAEHNIDFEWAFHFLYDFGYWWLDFMQSRRANESAKLDLLWCEFLCSGRTMVANKTNYGYMAVMQVYFGSALHPAVDALYHRTRTLPTSSSTPGTNVGLDWFPEDLNLYVKADVTSHISRAQINKRIAEHRLVSLCHEGLMSVVHADRKDPLAKLKKFDTDCASIKKFLNENIADTWRNATKSRKASKLGLTTRATKNSLPWVTMESSMVRGAGGSDETMYEYVERTVKRLAPWHQWRL
jgi:hypothetical protein